jgi:hypothetical protein
MTLSRWFALSFDDCGRLERGHAFIWRCRMFQGQCMDHRIKFDDDPNYLKLHRFHNL